MKATFYTLGCRLNQAETSLIANSFAQNGYDVVGNNEKADVCVINSCTVTDQADAKCRQLVRQVLRRNPETYVAVVGCYAQIGATALKAIDGIDLIIGTEEKMNVANYITAPTKRDTPLVIRGKMTKTPFTIGVKSDFLPTTRANLKIQDGCNFMCSFCVIPFARGRARSRDFADIQREAGELIAFGAKELIITGVNIGTYSFEQKGILEVVEMLLDVPGLERLRISSIEPTTIPDALLDLMAHSEKLCSHLHIPIQSGSDSVLTGMRRLYNVDEFSEFVNRAARKVPDILIGTDIMVGFPGESDAMFKESCQYFVDSPLAYAHIFTYSERSGTLAARSQDKVDARVKKERSRYLHQISEQKKKAFYQKFLGKQLRVLTEETDRGGRWLGFSDNYIKVAIPGKDLQANSLVEITVNNIENGLAVAA